MRRDIIPPVHLLFSILAGLVLSCVWTLLCEQAAHIQYITYTDTYTLTYRWLQSVLSGVCVCLCVEEGGGGDVVPRISITGSRAGVSPHTKDAGTLEALGPNRGTDGRGKRKSASARLTNSILTYIQQSGE